ncbi:MAG TPA: hypothetical protein PLO20_13110 [Thermogutta sp.]|nr:hypothetical protein [Thermogutta sp.]
MDDCDFKHRCEQLLHQMETQRAEAAEFMKELRSSLAEMRSLYEAHHRRLAGVDESLTRINHELWGNGRTGLAVQVRAILWIASGTLGFLVILAAEVFSKWL